MATLGGMWAPVAMRLLRVAVDKTAQVARSKLATAAKPVYRALPKSHHFSTNYAGRQPIHPSALVRQLRRSPPSKAPWRSLLQRISSYSSAVASATRAQKAALRRPIPNEFLGCIARSTTRAPFASTLRPSLTGGALPRSAGGYGLGVGGVRYFSHTPAAPAQVINNVSQAMRAFALSGHKALYDGPSPLGEKRYRAVSTLEDEAAKKIASVPRFAPGAYIDFKISPTLTALSPLASAFPFASPVKPVQAETTTLNTEGFLDFLSGDFDRAVKDLTTVFTDLKRLAFLGDLPVAIESPTVLRVRFPGVDAETVERLCDDTGVRRGFVGQDPDFSTDAGVDMALRFPFAPDGASDRALSSPGGTLRSLEGHELEDSMDEAFFEEAEANPWLTDVDGCESHTPRSEEKQSEDYEGLEGIYRFIAECERSRGKY